ncbi:carbohydrate ABC transporter permease [Pasteurella atlantica]|uniref:carbohydrate ABC transporter permease n=1 Tax=Pasteurellaceae TaxID=712 RepID=UPI00275608C9|nr:carbohydrate ABC transporter permease [Pasteurella atlantica]MDP8034451.1 carbohydrate ABC transporter permease [Pasteurella atlantica]MDP8036382.1 carbohydrate ABC transporter permease [Pasteurella atlantica]MDP8038349.1 carbohydrate ABC transporter permease [Pasteurella atlantica]MDP8048721.1 carbohydrate ABC transporter permease [Pasteurella atlantica]MDP8050678.1 carbohydrate ABC transporter permease [Pasteurella atlantica]
MNIKSQKRKKTLTSILIHLFLIVFAIIMLTPFVWMILTAFKTNTEATSVNPFVIWPEFWRTQSFTDVLHKLDFLILYKNTLLMIVGRIFFALVTAAMAGYALARLDFFGKKVVFMLVLIQMMVPVQLFIIPQYVMISKMDATNTIFALIFPGLVTAFGTFLMRQSFMSLPKELEEAARLDGCNIGQTFLYIMLPLTKSSLIALGIFTALFGFKDLMWTMIVNRSPDAMVLAPALAKMQRQFAPEYPDLMAASLIACIPMIIIYLIFQKHFIEGIATSGGKL